MSADLDRLTADLIGLGAVTRAVAHGVVVAHGARLQSAVKRHAAQPRTAPRPRGPVPEGPRLLTGSYNRSIHRRTTQRAHESTTVVGTSDERGPWLEFGTRHAASYPHFGPGLDDVEPGFRAAMAAVPGEAARRTRRMRP